MPKNTDATYVGAVVMEINGRTVDIISIKPKTSTGRKVVKTMNPSGKVRGFADGVTEYSLSLTAAIPFDGTEIDWENISKAKITIYPVNKEEKRTSYLNCFSTECSSAYEVENEARIDIEMIALNKVIE